MQINGLVSVWSKVLLKFVSIKIVLVGNYCYAIKDALSGLRQFFDNGKTFNFMGDGGSI